MLFSWSCVKSDPELTRRVSSSGVSEDTVIVVATDAIFIGIATPCSSPRLTVTFVRSTVEKPLSSVLTV